MGDEDVTPVARTAEPAVDKKPNVKQDKIDASDPKKKGKKSCANDEAEKDGLNTEEPPHELQRNLKSRHLQMIAIGESSAQSR